MVKVVVSAILLFAVLHLTQGVDPFGHRHTLGDVGSHHITEASGLAASQTKSTVLYTHNDSGDSNRFFAINKVTGKRYATYTVRGAINYDWEDIAYGPCADDCAVLGCSELIRPTRYCIYLADTGDRGGAGADNTIYMVREPEILTDSEIDYVDKLEFTWPETNAETLMIAPDGQLYIVSKVDGGQAKMAALPSQGWTSRTPIDMSKAVTLQISTTHKDPQGGDISPDGTEMVLICEADMFYYRIPNRDYLQVVGTQQPAAVRNYERVKATEAICFSADASMVYILPEGVNQNLYFYPRTLEIL